MQMDAARQEAMQEFMESLFDNDSFAFAFNIHVDWLIRLTKEDASDKEKYEVATRIVNATVKHLKEDEIDMEERNTCELLLSFYQFLQALYESRINAFVKQAYIDRLAEIYNEKRQASGIKSDVFENCDFLYTGKRWEYVDFDKLIGVGI